MVGTQLSDEELRQAAAEAGISPQELRIALAERHGNLPARPSAAGALVGPPSRGLSATHVEARIASPPKHALAAIKTSIERQTGKRGHGQGDGEADIVDDDAGITYRMRASDDGSGGALVRIDLDPSQAKGTQALATTGVLGISITLIALGWLFGALTFWMGGLGIGMLGGLLIARSSFKLRRAGASAHAIAAHALMEVDDAS